MPPTTGAASTEPLWIFGYGSLMWRTDFAFNDRRPCFIRNYRRRFWQGSTDHRGEPGAPGRVVTLLSQLNACCWGIAYRVADADRSAVLAQLDHREKGGYARSWESVRSEPEAQPFARALVYVATPDNPNYLGPTTLHQMVEQIAHARGPSGANSEYLLELARSLRRIDVVDEHVAELDRALRERLAAL
jgi:cation transport protein ChaC